MSCSLAINFYTENIGHSLTFETSHFLNSSIHHGELVYRRGGADLVLYLFKMPSEFKFKHQFLKLASKEILLTSSAPHSGHICCSICQKQNCISRGWSVLQENTELCFNRSSPVLWFLLRRNHLKVCDLAHTPAHSTVRKRLKKLLLIGSGLSNVLLGVKVTHKAGVSLYFWSLQEENIFFFSMLRKVNSFLFSVSHNFKFKLCLFL